MAYKIAKVCVCLGEARKIIIRNTIAQHHSRKTLKFDFLRASHSSIYISRNHSRVYFALELVRVCAAAAVNGEGLGDYRNESDGVLFARGFLLLF